MTIISPNITEYHRISPNFTDYRRNRAAKDRSNGRAQNNSEYGHPPVSDRERESDRETDRRTGRQPDRQTDRQTVRETDTQTQTDIQTCRGSDRERERQREVYLQSRIEQISEESWCGCRSKIASLGPQVTKNGTEMSPKWPNIGQQLGSNIY